MLVSKCSEFCLRTHIQNVACAHTTHKTLTHPTSTDKTTMSIATSRARRKQTTKSYADEPSPPPSPNTLLKTSLSDDNTDEDDFINQHDKTCFDCAVAGVPVKYYSDSKGDLKCCFACVAVYCRVCLPDDPGSNWRCENCVARKLEIAPQFLDVTDKELSEYELKNLKAREKNSAFWQKLSSSSTSEIPKVAKQSSAKSDDYDPQESEDSEDSDEEIDASRLKSAVEAMEEEKKYEPVDEQRKLIPSKFQETKRLVYTGITKAKGLSNKRVKEAIQWEEKYQELVEFKVRLFLQK